MKVKNAPQETLKNAKPFFSIVIPVYNVAPYLGECLDSLLAQTCPDWEALCVDDGSTDGSGAILDAYAEKDPCIRVFHQANGGVSSARNQALDAVRGEWLGFLDSDDAYHPQTLERVKTEIDTQGGLDVVSFGRCRDRDLLTQSASLPSPRYRVFRECVEVSYIEESLWSRFYRFTVVRDLRFKPYTMAEDTLYSAEACVRFSKGCVLDVPLYYYREREGSAYLAPLSVRKVQDDFDGRADGLQVLLSHHVNLPHAVLRRECVHLSEFTSFRMSQIQMPKAFCQRRYQRLLAFSREKALPNWFRCTFFIVGRLRFRILDKLMMEFPFRLKLFRNWFVRQVKRAK